MPMLANEAAWCMRVLEQIEAVGIDLEYAIRAWCVLERCYLPDVPHGDVRVVKLIPLLVKLKEAAVNIVLKKEIEPALQIINTVEQLNGLLALCQARGTYPHSTPPLCPSSPHHAPPRPCHAARRRRSRRPSTRTRGRSTT